MTHTHPKVSVIVPVYNAAPYIEKCARSLFEQTLDSIEYIFVNDKTPDNSIDILRQVLTEYPQRMSCVKIIDMPTNSKQAAARSCGLKEVSGEYVIHCDPDDWVDIDYYEQMYNTARYYGLDIVLAGYVLHSGDSIKRILPNKYSNPLDHIQSDYPCILSLVSHLVNTELIRLNNIDFFEGINYSEDFGFIARALYFAQSIGYVSSSFYHYNKDNYNSITRKMNDSHIVAQRIECLKMLDNFFSNKGMDITKLGLLQRYKRDIKDLLLNKSTLREWQRLFPEVSNWVVMQKDASLPYRIAYWLSHHIGIWPMRIFLTLKNII